jgi:hypothetical protein
MQIVQSDEEPAKKKREEKQFRKGDLKKTVANLGQEEE